jgi:hypothetical protein
MSVTTSLCTFKEGKGSTLANIITYIIEHISKILVGIAFARRTTELYTFVILHYELAKRASPFSFTI